MQPQPVSEVGPVPPIAGKFLLYVNQSLDATSDKISSFSVKMLYFLPRIQTGSEVSGKSSNSANRRVSYVKVVERIEVGGVSVIKLGVAGRAGETGEQEVSRGTWPREVDPQERWMEKKKKKSGEQVTWGAHLGNSQSSIEK